MRRLILLPLLALATQSWAAADEGRFFDWPRDAPAEKGLAGMSPWERGTFLAEQLRFSQYPVAHGAWWLDATPEVSQTQRLVFAAACIRAMSSELEGLAVWAMCADDMGKLDRKAFEAEVSSLDAEVREKVLKHFDWATGEIASRSEMVTRLAKEDPGVDELVNALPAKARQDWEKARAEAAGGFEAARDVLDLARKGSRAALAPCGKLLWPHFSKRMKAVEKDVGLVGILFVFANTPVDDVLLGAMATCEGVGGWEADKSGPAMGARIAVLRATWTVGEAIKFDAKSRSLKGKVQALTWGEGPKGSRPPGNTNSARAKGIILKVADAGDLKHLTFKQEKYTIQECVAEKETNKIERIEDGKIKYRTVCTKWAPKVVRETQEPIDVPTRFAGQLAPGRFAIFTELFRDGGDKRWAPIVVYRGPSNKTPLVGRFGVGL